MNLLTQNPGFILKNRFVIVDSTFDSTAKSLNLKVAKNAKKFKSIFWFKTKGLLRFFRDFSCNSWTTKVLRSRIAHQFLWCTASKSAFFCVLCGYLLSPFFGSRVIFGLQFLCGSGLKGSVNFAKCSVFDLFPGV